VDAEQVRPGGRIAPVEQFLQHFYVGRRLVHIPQQITSALGSKLREDYVRHGPHRGGRSGRRLITER
jgi:hypothetical protein